MFESLNFVTYQYYTKQVYGITYSGPEGEFTIPKKLRTRDGSLVVLIDGIFIRN